MKPPNSGSLRCGRRKRRPKVGGLPPLLEPNQDQGAIRPQRREFHQSPNVKQSATLPSPNNSPSCRAGVKGKFLRQVRVKI